MKLQMTKFLAFFSLLMVWFSCSTNDIDDHGVKWDGSKQQEEFRPINIGNESSYFTIDNNIISFAVPYLVGTVVFEYIPISGWGSPEGLSPYFFTVTLIMAKGTDVSKLSPIVTLAPGATITLIETSNEQVPSNQVDYTGITNVGEYNFRHQVDFTVIAPDGSTVKYKFLAVAIGDIWP